MSSSGFEYGMDLEVLRSHVDCWRDGYDWRAREARFNTCPQFTTTAVGEGLRFQHVRSPHPGALRMVLLHGYMGSVVQFMEMIDPLTDPTTHGGDASDAFHLVVLSLPGHGLSGPIRAAGFGTGVH
jgi:pimeloyl-ACP methyl ester carboxylesterase